jgi:HD-GYP domain-containing protein (c-di-GMP phosphodiesterase class II)
MTKENHIQNITGDKKLGRLLEKVVREVRSYAEYQLERIGNLTSIGLALSGEKNIGRLLEMIVDEARRIANADAGTLYILDKKENCLRFQILQNDTMNIRKGGISGEAIDDLPSVPLYDADGHPNHANVSSYVALTGKRIAITDVYEASEFEFSGTRKYDSATGYRSRSMLVIPMADHENRIIGVLQLLNATDPESGEVVSFLSESVDLVASLASQAAVALTNARLIEDLQKLFDSFIRSIATAIDEKSPFTGGHIARVVTLTMDIARAINESDRDCFKDVRFSPDELEELRIAAWMHDIGKITTPEHLVSKTNKLEGIFDRIELLETRFALIQQVFENECLKRKIEILQSGEAAACRDQSFDQLNADLQRKITDLANDLDLLRRINSDKQQANEQTVVHVAGIAKKTFLLDGREQPYLTAEEKECLSILRGNLLESERKIIEHHAEMTRRITRELPFPERLARVPEYAAGHHEKLDGSGYPAGLKAADIPIQSRIIAVADVFEALTARDRPYKGPMTVSQALKILGFMKKDGHIDPDIYDLFVDKKLYLAYSEKELDGKQME